ncbi:alpha/beta hydrolase [Chryseobacterium sp. SNU WT5]|uniref:alpha/beta fold hydrolase n=1 Tax=Chryseobacterium sp. SNU WT5 TaxID=2594269 RepID=UPI00117D2964|nr:alpha/beta hydrolase [Chryseobacterium sp. SNU WT5]QDP85575.1 alpha/beta hydrolase [Chryseobacterium sp. SNU WT5]
MKTTVLNSYNDEAIVFLNPMGSDTRFWKKNFPDEILENYEVIFIDYPGYNSKFFKYKNFAEQAVDLCDNVLCKIKKPLHLIGYSYGGFLAQYIVNQNLENIKSMILIGSSYKLNPINIEINSVLKSVAKENLLLFCRSLSIISHEADEINSNPLMGLQKFANLKLSIDNSDVICNQLEHLLKHKSITFTCDKSLNTLIIYGENDKMMSDADINYYRNYFENLKVFKLRNESHMIPTETLYPLIINHFNTIEHDRLSFANV